MRSLALWIALLAALHGMKGVGHAFPESQYPAARAWLGGPAMEPE